MCAYTTPLIFPLLKLFSPINVILHELNLDINKYDKLLIGIKETDLYQKTYDQNDQLILLNQYYLLYFYTYSYSNFSVSLKKYHNSQILQGTILSFPNIFKNINYNDIAFIAIYANSKEQIYGLLKLIKSFFYLCTFIDKIYFLINIAFMLEISYDKLLFRFTQQLLLSLLRFYSNYEQQSLKFKHTKQIANS